MKAKKKTKKILAIPDIHGESGKLDSLLKKINIKELDLLIFLGDMVDRGPDSVGVLKRVRALTKKHPNVVALKGNHEDMMIISKTHNKFSDRMLWESNGGGFKVSEELIKWAAGLPLWWEYDNFFFSHAPVPPKGYYRNDMHKPLDCGYTKDELIWGYYGGDNAGEVEGKIGVCGHIHMLRFGIKEPRFYDKYIFCDAGCGCSKSAPLVAVDVVNRTFITSD